MATTAPKLVSQSEFKIEKGVPRSAHGIGKYPWAQMEVGDSFFVDGAERGSLHSTASGWALRHEVSAKFSTAVEGEGVRIWRTA